MIYQNEEGRYPSVLVDDGETMVLSLRDARETGIPVLRFRPRSTAALLAMAGLPQPAAPRLSDREAFERIESTEGMVSLFEPDQDGRISGYSVAYIRGVLGALDPAERMPPRSVRRVIRLEEEEGGCGCSSKHTTGRKAVASAQRTSAAAYAADSGQASSGPYSVREATVPDFLASLQVFSLFTHLGDIVVGRNATLVLESDIVFAIANNFLAYRGSRIVQRAQYLNLDITDRMRGGAFNVVHTVADARLKVNWHELEQASKP